MYLLVANIYLVNQNNNGFPSDFIDILPEILKDIAECSFIAIDGEFTGLASERNMLPFDTSQEYYEKQVKTSSGFILVQLGLSFFKAKASNEEEGTEEEKTTCKSYNIYVYPQARNATFSCQGQSLQFLAANGFDFNKLFTSAISYCDEAEEEKLRQEIAEKQAYRMEQLQQRASDEPLDAAERNFIPVPENEIKMIDQARDKIQMVLIGAVPEVLFDKVNPYQRKLIYELIERDFNNKVSVSTRTLENNKKGLVVQCKLTNQEELELEKVRQKEDEVHICEVTGLRLIMKEISASKKLIVGHNCLLDFMYLISQCFEQLPEDYAKFKALTHRIFPHIIDTKFIGNSEKFKEIFSSTVLNQIYERLLQEPFEKIKIEWENINHTYDLDSPKEHEAGYDSFLTGYCLLAFLKYLKVPLANLNPSKCKELNPFLNRIALQRIPTPFIHLTGKEPAFSRAHVFFIKFPQTWQTSDIQDHFKNYGPIQISWVNNASAFISLYNKENSSCVEKTISRPDGFEIQSFTEFHTEAERKRDLSCKRKKEDSESSEGSNKSKSNNSSNAKDKKQKKRGKKAFKESDNW